MTLILSEISRLTKSYEDLKSYLLEQTTEKELVSTESKFSKEVEYQRYMEQKRKSSSVSNAYHHIAAKISTILRQSEVPLSNRQIFDRLIQDDSISVTYSNLTHNILRKMAADKNMNVEKAYRGYWQYRLKSL